VAGRDATVEGVLGGVNLQKQSRNHDLTSEESEMSPATKVGVREYLNTRCEY
jgi:hypothetical protein